MTHFFSIPHGLPFAKALAKGAVSRLGLAPGDLALADLLILVPTRRAIAAVAGAFAEMGSRLLPNIRALGALDEEDGQAPGEPRPASAFLSEGEPGTLPAIEPLERNWRLAQLILKWTRTGEGARPDLVAAQRSAPDAAQALALAESLGRLMDEATIEGISWDGMIGLVPDELAAHWQITASFLTLIVSDWPQTLKALGLSDPVARRMAALERIAEEWAKAPPAHPVIIAGSTGSVSATAKLMGVVAQLPHGYVVLPGLDQALEDEAWDAIGPEHPQAGLRKLLSGCGMTRRDVAPWTEDKGNAARATLLREALRPAATIGQWVETARTLKPELERAMEGLSYHQAPTEGDEALMIALQMREALDVPRRTAALVTANRNLARRVACELRRWDIACDDSAGVPLSETAAGAFLGLILEAVTEDLAPVPLLSLLKHPLAALGLGRARTRAATTALELEALRGPRPQPRLNGLRAALPGKEQGQAASLLDALETALAPLAALIPAPQSLPAWARAHRATADALSADDGATALWGAHGGPEAQDLLDSLAELGGADETVPLSVYAHIIRRLMKARAVRTVLGAHPRLAIWGPLEARLQTADLMILGGLNEGVWPPAAESDVWLNRPMREKLGLAAPERQIGLAAHDFESLSAAPELRLTRAEKADGKPVNPSRFLVRLETLSEAAGLGAHWKERSPYLDWAHALDRPERVEPAGKPMPCPPLSARPRSASVTGIDRWVRDPYAFYARTVLALTPLNALDQNSDAAEQGTVIHKALELFVRRFPGELPPDPRRALQDAGEEAFAGAGNRPSVRALWWPRFLRIAAWLAEEERARRVPGMSVLPEIEGALDLSVGGESFQLRAKADRIEIGPGGKASILDYKTGAAPTPAEIKAFFAPQLPLEGAILLAGGFAGVAAQELSGLIHLEITGRSRLPGKIKAIEDPTEAAKNALTGLEKLIRQYRNENMPFLSRPRVKFAKRFDEYAALARTKEWRTEEAEE